MNLDETRIEIDKVDAELKTLMRKRMDLSKEVAVFKSSQGIPILNKKREREVISKITENMDDNMACYFKIIYNTIFDVSRSYQNTVIYKDGKIKDIVEKSLSKTEKIFPRSATVACQGVEGSNSQIAATKLVSRPNIMYFSNFDGVFNAVEKGLCRYGILPIENNLAGSVTAVYDLMKQYDFHIAKSIKLRIEHSLMIKNGGKLSDIKEIISHEQALSQCSDFLEKLGVKVTAVENTATAAEMVANTDRTDLACISSPDCSEIYGLKILDKNIGNSDNNYTRFICISKSLEIYPGASKISLMFSVPHVPGSLYQVISRFSALDVNITKLESRPVLGKDFEFLFYYDMDATIYSPEVINALCELETFLPEFVFLGSYSEV